MSVATGSELADKRIVVTGGAGMIGANLIHRLVSLDVRPHVLVRRSTSRMRLEGVRERLHIIEGDLTDSDSIERMVDDVRPEVVFHLASTFFNPPTLPAREHLYVNAIGTQILLEALRQYPDVPVVYLGSAAVYGDGSDLKEDSPLEPTTIYGASKAAATMIGRTYARIYGIRFVELRLFSAFGPWERTQRLIPYTILSALAGTEIQISNGAQERDFLYVGDVVDALILSASKSLEPGEVLNVCSGVGRPVQEIVDTILRVMGSAVPVRSGARPTRKDEIWKISGDASAAARRLGWRPRTPFREGLESTVAWFKENPGFAERLA